MGLILVDKGLRFEDDPTFDDSSDKDDDDEDDDDDAEQDVVELQIEKYLFIAFVDVFFWITEATVSTSLLAESTFS